MKPGDITGYSTTDTAWYEYIIEEVSAKNFGQFGYYNQYKLFTIDGYKLKPRPVDEADGHIINSIIDNYIFIDDAFAFTSHVNSQHYEAFLKRKNAEYIIDENIISYVKEAYSKYCKIILMTDIIEK